MTVHRSTLYPRPPFDFELTAGYHTYFQSRSGADTHEEGVYRRLLYLGDKLALASVRSVGNVDAPELVLEVECDSVTARDAHRAAEQVSWLLGLDQDLAPFYARVAADSVMAGLVSRSRGLHVPHTGSVFEALVLAVLGQQIAAAVARMIRLLIIETFGRTAEFGGRTYHAFPQPEAIWESSPEALRKMRLTQRKSEYVHGISGAALDPSFGMEQVGSLPFDEAVRRLTAIRGVGEWTAQWALLRSTSHANALPLGDLALRRAVSRLFRNGEAVTDGEVEEAARGWEPYRTYATVYLFSALRTGMV